MHKGDVSMPMQLFSTLYSVWITISFIKMQQLHKELRLVSFINYTGLGHNPAKVSSYAPQRRGPGTRGGWVPPRRSKIDIRRWFLE